MLTRTNDGQEQQLPVAEGILTHGQTLYVVSDLHMGSGEEDDSFLAHVPCFESFLAQVLERDPMARLVLAGDVFDFWHALRKDAYANYSRLLHRLATFSPILIPGNHETAILFFGYPPVFSLIKACLVEELVVRRGDRIIRIVHGNELDRFRDRRKGCWAGVLVPWLLRMLRIKALKRLRKHNHMPPLTSDSRGVGTLLMACWASIHRYLVPKGQHAEIQYAVCYDALREYHRLHPREVVVAGHTHTAGWYSGWYLNTGAWHSTTAHYARITCDGEISLHQWPTGEVVMTQLNEP